MCFRSTVCRIWKTSSKKPNNKITNKKPMAKFHKSMEEMRELRKRVDIGKRGSSLSLSLSVLVLNNI